MNSADLDRLGKLMEEGAAPDVPGWLRTYVQGHRDEMIRQLNAGKSVTVTGPDGQIVVIEPTREATAA